MNTKKWVLGLTGGISTGKTTVSNAFKQFGCRIVDADICARLVVKPGTNALKLIHEHFGDNILNSDNTLNRKQLREIIFTDESEKKFLNDLLHPLIRQEIIDQINAPGNECYIILAAPLLFENHLEDLTDRVLCMDIDEDTQISRTMERDNCSKEVATNIVKSQLPREVKVSKSDDVLLSNMPTPEKLTIEISKIHFNYLAMSSKYNLKKPNN